MRMAAIVIDTDQERDRERRIKGLERTCFDMHHRVMAVGSAGIAGICSLRGSSWYTGCVSMSHALASLQNRSGYRQREIIRKCYDRIISSTYPIALVAVHSSNYSSKAEAEAHPTILTPETSLEKLSLECDVGGTSIYSSLEPTSRKQYSTTVDSSPVSVVQWLAIGTTQLQMHA
jgi:hypothetical protein